jgi:hypothetical protein
MNISFVNPGFLFALLLVAVPVIVHLFNFRRFKKVYFTNVRFLRELKEETTNRSRLKHLLVLISRILAVIFLVLAFAQPYVPVATGKKLAASRAVSIFIDNSFSMDAVTREGTLLDVSVKKAKEIAQAYQPSDRFQLLTNDFDPVHQRLLSRDEFISTLDQVRISPSSRKLTEIITRQKDALSASGAEEKTAMILSDFQVPMANIAAIQQDSSLEVIFIPVNASETSNLYVDSCWFTAPVVQQNQPAELNVRIRNSGKIDVEGLPVKLIVNGSQKAVAGVSVAPSKYADIKLTFTPVGTGWQKGEVIITDNPIIFDDHYFFSFNIAQNLPVGIINGSRSGPYLKALFGGDSYFALSESPEGQIDYSSFAKNKLLIVNEATTISSGLSSELAKYVKNGGTLVIIPDSAIDFTSYTSFFNELSITPFSAMMVNNEKVEKLTLDDPVFEGVFSNSGRINDQTDLPLVQAYYTQSGGARAQSVLMQLRSGAPLLSKIASGKGIVYLFHASLEGGMTNLARHAIFVPVMYRIALLSERSVVHAGFIGKDDFIELPPRSIGGEEVFHLTNDALRFDIIPGYRATASGILIQLNHQVKEAGNYELKNNNELLFAPSFNFNRDESQMEFMNTAALEEMIESVRLGSVSVVDVSKAELKNHFSRQSEGIRLWKYCIILVLLFLAIEILLLKFWKK